MSRAAGESVSLTVKVTVSFSGSPMTPERGINVWAPGAEFVMIPGVSIVPIGKFGLAALLLYSRVPPEVPLSLPQNQASAERGVVFHRKRVAASGGPFVWLRITPP